MFGLCKVRNEKYGFIITLFREFSQTSNPKDLLHKITKLVLSLVIAKILSLMRNEIQDEKKGHKPNSWNNFAISVQGYVGLAWQGNPEIRKYGNVDWQFCGSYNLEWNEEKELKVEREHCYLLEYKQGQWNGATTAQ